MANTEIVELLDRSSLHWKEDFFYGYDKHRTLFTELMGHMHSHLALMIVGPRRVGKTVLMKQMIDTLIRNGVSRKKILYVELEKDIRLNDVIREWERSYSIDLSTQTCYLFLDEVQFLNNWGSQVKLFYDSYPKLKIILSGSSSLLLRKGNESLAGRIFEYLLPPLSFEEYLLFKGITLSTLAAYEKYLNSQLPEIVQNDEPAHKYIESLVRKVIYEDTPQLYRVENTDVLENIFRVICREPGQIMNYEDLSKDFGINRATVSKYMDILVNSMLVRKVYNFSKNARKTEKRSKKFYPLCATFCSFIHPLVPDFSLLAETDVAMKLNSLYFYNDEGREIDFLTGTDLSTGIEVKMRKRIDKTDIRTLIINPLKLKKRMLIVPPDAKIKLDTSAKGIDVIDIVKFSRK